MKFADTRKQFKGGFSVMCSGGVLLLTEKHQYWHWWGLSLRGGYVGTLHG
jgi:hypothetical protein